MADDITPEAATPEAVETPSEPVITLTQSEYNAKLAGNKRKLQSDLAESKKKAAAYEALQQQVSEALQSGLFEGVETLDEFANAASSTISQLQSDAERYAAEQAKTTKALTAAQQAAEAATAKFNAAQIRQAVNNAAPIGDKVVSAGALDLVHMSLSQYAQVKDDDSVVFVMDVKDEDGNTVKAELTAAEAVSQMESNVSQYGTLFKSTVNAGAGGEIIDGVKRTPTGGIDLSNLSMEKFMELENKNPGAVAASLTR